MDHRQITTDDVEWALKRRVGDPSPGEPGTVWIHGLACGGRELKVCVPVDDLETIITVAWPDNR